MEMYRKHPPAMQYLETGFLAASVIDEMNFFMMGVSSCTTGFLWDLGFIYPLSGSLKPNIEIHPIKNPSPDIS